MKLRVATGQFPIDADIERNLAFVRRQIAAAKRRRADVVLFPEAALGGYPGADFASFAGYDWDLLRHATEVVLDAARRHRIWVVLGSNHRLSGRSTPHNSLYVIDPKGDVVDRYDKRVCAGPPGARDLAHYRPGDHPVTVHIRGVRCGLLICHEWRYPEVYRQYKALGVEVILQGWYDGGLKGRIARTEGRANAVAIPAAVQGHAVCNHLWICGANTSRRFSCFGGFAVRPDGTFLARQPRHRPGVLVHTIDTALHVEDMSVHARARIMRGLDRFVSSVSDRRSTDRRCY